MKYIIILLAMLSITPATTAQDALTDADITALAKGFLDAKYARQKPETTVADIDHFLSLLADEFTDEHLAWNVVITDKAKLRKGMIAKMEDKITASTLILDDIMVGPKVAFVRFTESVTLKRAYEAEPVSFTGTSVISLEFNAEGKITHIRRHN